MISKKISYSIIGSLIGLAIGCFAGMGELNYVKNSQRASELPIALFLGGIAGAGIGASLGYRLGRTLHIENITGIDSSETTYSQQGRFWIGTTVVTDKRNNIPVYIVTAKSVNKILVTELNHRLIIAHNTNSASKVTVEKFHIQARNTVFRKLKDLFVEEFPTDFTSLF